MLFHRSSQPFILQQCWAGGVLCSQILIQWFMLINRKQETVIILSCNSSRDEEYILQRRGQNSIIRTCTARAVTIPTVCFTPSSLMNVYSMFSCDYCISPQAVESRELILISAALSSLVRRRISLWSSMQSPRQWLGGNCSRPAWSTSWQNVQSKLQSIFLHILSKHIYLSICLSILI